MISAIQESGEDNNDGLMFAYGVLARFSEADNTSDGYEKALYYYEKVRDWHKSEGDEIRAKRLEAVIDNVKSNRDGREGKQISDEVLNGIQSHYEKCVKERGESSTETLQAGISLSLVLHNSGINGLECERLSKKLAIISRRVLGPDHELTRHAEIVLDLCTKRRVGMMTDDGVKQYQALRFDDEEGKHVVNGPISDPRKPDEEEIMTVAMNDIILIQGSPVMCHGLRNAAHLNGKVGDTRSFDNKTGRYRVRFEDKSLKSALVKPGNLRIAFDLPDEK